MSFSAEEQQNTLEIIVSQLKSYGFYTLAKGISDQAKLGNIDASNQLQQLVKKNVVKQAIKQDTVHKQGGLDFNSKKTKLNPNYKSRFQTQHRGPGRATAFSPDGNFIATGSEDTTLKVLDVHAIREFQNGMEDKRVLKTLYDHTGPVNEVAFHPNGSILASCSDDGMIKFYDLEKKNTKKGFRYLADAYPVRSISFHPSGEFILSGTDHHAVRLYEISNMKCYIPSSHNDYHQGAITKVRYAPNGSTFATSSVDGSIKIYDAETSKCINTIAKAHDGASVIGIAWSSSSSYLLSTGISRRFKT
jgi:cleavage stimulation factor subunit 1